jgi:hypothetical protein
VKSGYERVAPRYELSKKQLDAFIKENAHFGFFNPDTQINVELHWKFFPGHTHSFDFDYLWQNRQIIKTGESLVPVCSADDTIMLLLIHGAKHSWRRLLWLNDIFLILGNYTDRDWKRLIDRIERLDIERLSVSAIMLLHDLFGLTLPDDINKMAGRDKKTAFLVRVSKTLIEESDESHLAAIFSSRLKFILCNFFMVPGIRYEVTFALRTIFPCDFEYIFLPDRLFFLYYLFRPFFWFFRKFTGIKPMHAKRRS